MILFGLGIKAFVSLRTFVPSQEDRPITHNLRGPAAKCGEVNIVQFSETENDEPVQLQNSNNCCSVFEMQRIVISSFGSIQTSGLDVQATL